jgi:hypothetical protein
MYSDDMTIGSWASLQGRCTAEYSVNDEDEVEFSFRSGSQSLDLAFDAQTLETFLQLGTVALREMAEMRVASRQSHTSGSP